VLRHAARQVSQSSIDTLDLPPPGWSGEHTHTERDGLGGVVWREGGGVAEEEAAPQMLDIASFMHKAPLAVQADFPAARVHTMFCTLGLRHLTVVRCRSNPG